MGLTRSCALQAVIPARFHYQSEKFLEIIELIDSITDDGSESAHELIDPV